MILLMLVDSELNDIVENPPRLGVVAAHHLPDVLHQLLGAEGLVRMQPAIDPDDGLTITCELPRRGLGQRLSRRRLAERQLLRGASVGLDLRVVGRRRDDGHQHRPVLRRPADLDEMEPVRLLRQLGPVRDHLLVVDEEVVVTDVVSPLLHWRGERRAGERRGRLRSRAAGARLRERARAQRQQ
jgi:hypothetical protein